MNRQQKEQVVEDFRALLTESNATFLIGYRGLTVAQLQDLRGRLRSEGALLKVTKARLMKIAAQGIEGVDSFSDQFKDQIGLVFAQGEVPAVAKQLIESSKNGVSLEVRSAFFESRVISNEEIDFLASIPPRDVLLAQVVGTIQAPLSSFVRVLDLMIVRLLYVLKRIAEKSQ